MAVGGIAAFGAIAGLLGTGAQVAGTLIAAKGQKKAERAAKLEAQNRARQARRQSIREAAIARAQSLSNATNQGAQFSSSAQGGQSSAVAQGARNVQNINIGEEISNKTFAANRQITRGNTISNLGAGLSNFGSTIGQNAPTIGRAFGGFVA